MQQSNHLHIVTFNVPWPADYGGVIDVYYRMVGLVKAGVKIHLHCYEYGREKVPHLEQICEEVHYYRREVGWRHQFEVKPYIVASRSSRQLIENLQKDNYPILLEGLHNGFVLEQLAHLDRKISLRAHNVEHDYYLALSRVERSVWKRLFFWAEAIKLKHYEPVLAKASNILAINEKDASYFRNKNYAPVHVLPPSHGHEEVLSQLGTGQYVLYHGNLEVAENIETVEYILDNLVPNTDIAFVFAGRNPSDALCAKVAQYQHARIVANPNNEQMGELLRNAQVNVLFTEQSTGVKLKLINALYEGRHCLANTKMVEGTGLTEACVVADTADDQLALLQSLFSTPFDQNHLEKRKKILGETASFTQIKNIIL